MAVTRVARKEHSSVLFHQYIESLSNFQEWHWMAEPVCGFLFLFCFMFQHSNFHGYTHPTRIYPVDILLLSQDNRGRTFAEHNQKMSLQYQVIACLAAPSRIMAWTVGFVSISCEGTSSSKHSTRSGLLPVLSSPLFDNDSGCLVFIFKKSPSHI